ncbi:MAG: hypothetical protein RL660_2779 [Bacteroidota bacterium]|jgi:hypothetical protein
MKRVLVLLILLPTFCFGQWLQVGNQISGTESGEALGTSTSISGNGQVFSVGAQSKDMINATNVGQVQVFEFTNGTWTPKGSAINGDGAGDFFGESQMLSEDGNVLAIGATGLIANPPNAGYVKIYEFNGTNWIQRGTSLVGTAIGDEFGDRISLSADGTTLAVSANPIAAGYVKVFKWNGSAWNQLGSDLSSGILGDDFGKFLTLDSIGTTLVVGASYHDSPLVKTGRLIVYEWNGSNWNQKGTDIFGEVSGDYFGTGITINSIGTIMAAAGRGVAPEKGYVKIFEWNGSDWAQKGSKIISYSGLLFGHENDINSSGDLLISGCVTGNYAKIHKFQGTDWVLVDSLHLPNSVTLGNSVAMDKSGSTVVVGDYYAAPGGLTAAGQATVFKDASMLSIDNLNQELTLKAFPIPASNLVHIQCEQNVESYKVISTNGQVLANCSGINSSDFSIDVKDMPDGNYQLQLTIGGKTKTLRLTKN